MTKKQLIDQLIKGSEGKIVLWQTPNLPLVIWFISFVLTKLLPYGELNFVAALIAFGSLFTWAWLEITNGVNYFRRLVGLVVMVLIIASKIY